MRKKLPSILLAVGLLVLFVIGNYIIEKFFDSVFLEIIFLVVLVVLMILIASWAIDKFELWGKPGKDLDAQMNKDFSSCLIYGYIICGFVFFLGIVLLFFDISKKEPIYALLGIGVVGTLFFFLMNKFAR